MKNKPNGLPLEVQYCIECNLSNQQPTSTNEYFHTHNTERVAVAFDRNGICAACNFNKKKWDDSINWEEREKELIELCNKNRKSNGEYDCIVGGSGGKDSIFQSHVLKYKYNMTPLTVTWSPHLYTDIGWKNYQNWIHKGGFDNFLFTPNGKVHRRLTREATINLLHPFQPFIIGQKIFAIKMAHKMNIPLIFYGEMQGENGNNISHKISKFGTSDGNKSQKGFELDPLNGKKFEDCFIGGKQVKQYLEEGIKLSDLQSYKPLDYEIIKKKNIEFYFLGYFLRWIPQENYYYAVKHADFSANPERTEGTYQKYASMDDKIDGFFYYTRFIKFGVGRAMIDSSQEIRNGHITKEEGKALIEKFDGEYPKKYEDIFYDYISMQKNEFLELTDQFRLDHIWEKKSNSWVLKKKIV
ncbi:N-acetyl sugar amidotransferase [Candidatus Pelagibacter sp.]|nr:N-acetyl sugar amidotransferase [Candidatus Pelagibacter sp.]